MAALCEAGRPDLAERVHPNRAGWPSVRHADEDHDVVVRAFWLAHRSTGHQCRVGPCVTYDGEDTSGIICDDCYESSEGQRRTDGGAS